MGLVRLLDFALLTFLVWLVWSQVIRGWRAASAAATRAEPPASPASAGGAAAQPKATVVLERCAACGVFVPAGRTLPGPAGETFCSDACRASGARRTG